MTADGADIGFDGLTVAPLFTDTFDTAKRSEWVQNGGAWSVASGAYKETGTGSDDVTSVIGSTTTGDSEWLDFDMDAKVRFDTASDSNASAQLYTHYVDNNNWIKYALKFTGGGASQLIVSKKAAGTVSTIATVPIAKLTTGSWHLVHVLIENNRHRVYLDGQTLFDDDIYEPALEEGRVGIGTSKAAASFDDVAVNKLIQ